MATIQFNPAAYESTTAIYDQPTSAMASLFVYLPVSHLLFWELPRTECIPRVDPGRPCSHSNMQPFFVANIFAASIPTLWHLHDTLSFIASLKLQ